MIDGFTPTENVCSNAQALIDLALEDVGCPAEIVRELIITDDENFGKAIQLLAPGTTYTDNADYRAVAKTLALPPQNGISGSGIVLHVSIFIGAINALNKEPLLRSGEEQRFLYVVMHELGHALDYQRRPHNSKSEGLTTPQGFFKVRHIAKIYTDTVLSEAFACYASAFAYSQALFDLESESTNTVVSRHLALLHQEITVFQGDADHLRKIAFMSAQVFWLPFVQHGKLIAHRLGNHQLASQLPSWPDAADGTDAILSAYFRLLEDAIAVYPHPAEDFDERLFCLWKELARIHGYDFQEGTDGDGIYW